MYEVITVEVLLVDTARKVALFSNAIRKFAFGWRLNYLKEKEVITQNSLETLKGQYVKLFREKFQHLLSLSRSCFGKGPSSTLEKSHQHLE